MKKNLIISSLFTAVIGLLMCSSCSIETYDNGDLDGYWHLVGIDSLEDNTSTNLSEELVFWSFQYKLLQLVDRNGKRPKVYARFAHEGKSLRIYEIRKDGADNSLYEDTSVCSQYGLNSLDETFNVVDLSDKHLVLESATVRLRFRRM